MLISAEPNFAIRCDGLGKAYHVYRRPEDRLKQALSFGRGRYYHEFWALRDVSVTIAAGETVGVVGRNGSGKSTFLQMVCGVLTPTEGRAVTKGRVVALLELGSGFNPEFSGRENVYLSAAILGLSREETEARFAAIAGFAEIGNSIDQPVKHYSSGMHARLAFAVAAHVDADILIVDEILAVGDAAFSQKCMRFMRAFKERGTLCFVSHDSNAVIGLCDRALWLDQGRLRAEGPAKKKFPGFTPPKPMARSSAAIWSPGEGDRRKRDARRRKIPSPGRRCRSRPIATSDWTPSLWRPTAATQAAFKGGEALILDVAGSAHNAEAEPQTHRRPQGSARSGPSRQGRRYPPLRDAAARTFPIALHFFFPVRAGVFALDVTLVTGDRVRDRRHEAAILRVQPEAVTHGLVPWNVEVAYHLVSQGEKRMRVVDECGDRIQFTCNICGQPTELGIDMFQREKGICLYCGSVARFRGIVAALGEFLGLGGAPLPQWPENRAIRGIGMNVTATITRCRWRKD